MKKLLVSFLSIGFISATCIFVSCSKKKDDPAPVATTTTGGTTTGGSTAGTTSGTTSGTTITTINTGSFNDGKKDYPNVTSAFFSNSTSDQIALFINTNEPTIDLTLKKSLTVGTYTKTSNGTDYSG